MKIISNINNNVVNAYKNNKIETKKLEKKVTFKQDSIEISSESKQAFNELKNEKLMKISEEIQNGNYRIDSYKLAKKMIFGI